MPRRVVTSITIFTHHAGSRSKWSGICEYVPALLLLRHALFGPVLRATCGYSGFPQLMHPYCSISRPLGSRTVPTTDAAFNCARAGADRDELATARASAAADHLA